MSGPVQGYDRSDAACLCVDANAVAVVPEAIARRHRVVPLAHRLSSDGESHLVLASCRPDDRLIREPVERALLGADVTRIEWRDGHEDFIGAALAGCYGERSGTAIAGGLRERDAASKVDALLSAAIGAGASDLHLSPAPEGTRARVRVDGCLRSHAVVSRGWHAALLQRLKVLAGLDVAECRAPQDGRLRRLIAGERIQFRVSTFPVDGGENAVLRVQDPRRRPASLDVLGLEPSQGRAVRRLLNVPAGLIVVAGPVGSGKTTTAYAMLGELDDGMRNLVTLEDPIEYPLEGVVQAAVDPTRRIDFANGVRALLRQDPDVLLIGEIRDEPTCAIAIRAALTGLRVLATVHAHDARQAFARLLDLGAEPAALADALAGVIAQRLLPRAPVARRSGGPAEPDGRFAIVECLTPDKALRSALASGERARFDHALEAADLVPLAAQARDAVRAGRTADAAFRRVFGMSSDTREPVASPGSAT